MNADSGMAADPARILIVDDEGCKRQVLAAMLGPQGFLILTAQSGEEALTLVARDPPDLIVLDLIMPGMDGCRVAAILKGDFATRHIPIIMVTALDDREARLKGLEAGAEDFLSTPVDRAELCARVRNLLRLKDYGEHFDRYSQRLEGEVASRTADLVESARSLTLALERAEHANRVQENLLARVSHELRTPLNSILGWADLLERDTSPALLHRGLPVIKRNALAQEQVIKSLLDASSIDAGHLRLETRATDLGLVVRTALEIVRPAAGAKRLSIVSTGEGPAIVLGDPARLQQVVWNLLANAVKFTPEGGTIYVHLLSSGGRVRLEVSDDGIGIAPEFLPHVFSEFSQADTSPARKHMGLGLGLTIVRRLIEMHGGTVSAFSAGIDKGVTFAVELPAHDAHPAELAGADMTTGPTSLESGDLTGVRVLVVDDDPDSREIITTILERAGASTALADSGSTGLQRLLDLDLDVVVSDIAMPHRDGMAFIQDVRALPDSEKRRVPAVALTALASEQQRQAILAAGFQHCAAKPVSPENLIRCVASVCGRVGRPGADPPFSVRPVRSTSADHTTEPRAIGNELPEIA